MVWLIYSTGIHSNQQKAKKQTTAYLDMWFNTGLTLVFILTYN